MASSNPSSSKRDSVLRSAAKHNAYKVAAASKEAEKPTSSSAFAQISKAVIQMQILALQAQVALLEELEGMTDDEKTEVLFLVLDKDCDGSLSAVELADGLRKVRGDVGFEESIALAVDRVAHFDKDKDGKLQLDEFKNYADTLCEALGATFHELAEMLILSVAFGEGNNDEENFVAALAEEDLTAAIQESGKLQKIMEDGRMKALFHMFDLDASGTVDFQEVVMGVYKMTHDLDSAATTAVAALLIFDDDGNQTLDFAEFTKFILQIIMATGQSYDEAIFSMTQATAETSDISPEELSKLLAGLVVVVEVE